MPTITIDGKVCEFEGKKMILQVAQENGIELPSYCYHEGLSIVASCRICLASVAAPNPRNDMKVEWIPKLVPTCQTPASDGMIVDSKSEKAIGNQKAVMEYLLINHPLDCPVCDQAGECYLQDYSYQYGRGSSRFEEDKIKNPKKDIGNHVLLYSDRCIMCTRCVRFTREVSGTSELCVSGRGAKEEIDVFPGKALNNELSANVVDICPVGALLDKHFLFEQRVWFLKSTPSIDGITASGDNITVEHNEGKVYRIKPRKNLEVNKWWISDEIRYGWDFVHHDLRMNEMKLKAADAERNEQAEADDVYDTIRATAREKLDDGKRLALQLSPMLTCEDAYSLTAAALKMDPEAIIGIGPIPTEGEDIEFPGGYTVYAEKAPNARGVKRAAELLTGDGNVHDFASFTDTLETAGETASMLIITGNYTSEWITADVQKMTEGRYTILLDTLASVLSSTADVFIATCPWVEKAGTFENAKNQLQSFEQAFPPAEGTRSEGQVGNDLAARWDLSRATKFNAELTRNTMGGVFTTDVMHPVKENEPEPEMQYVTL